MINNNTRNHVTWDFPVTTTPAVQAKLESAYKTLIDKDTGASAEMRGWMNWPEKYLNSEEYVRLKNTAEFIRRNNNAVVVIGIGGSYLTPEAVLNCLYGKYHNRFATTEVYFAGNDLSPDLLDDLRSILEDMSEWSIVYVSKSGGTIEPALAFRVLWQELVNKYGEAADKHIYAVTDAEKGILKNLANEHGWESFVIPDDIGGRYSAFTACGLLPLAIGGIETDDLLYGALDAVYDFSLYGFAAEYAKWRYSQHIEGRRFVEFYAANTPDLTFLSEWLKQLFGESEGKDGKGILPTSGVFPRDLHSLGQFLQEGTRGIIFETFIIKEFFNAVVIPKSYLNDNLDKFEGKTFSQASAAAMDGAFRAHSAGGNPCGKIKFGSELEDLGYMMQSMFYACALYSYMLGVNPFNQPGVEQHKAQMKVSPEWDK